MDVVSVDSQPSNSAELRSGDTLGVYTLLEPIGAGGMGRVFKARHGLMDRVVALKLIRPELLADPAAAARFHKEMQLAARLSHPNIVTAYDAQQVDGLSFLAMEHCDGPSLRQVVRARGPLPAGLACELVRQAACGLQHAHERGLVHRDIKPDNLLLVGGTVKILDFGLARINHPVAGPAAHSDAPRGGGGTPDYLAPEQATDPECIDPRSDLYSLGATMFFLLTGEPPFAGGTSSEKILRHRLEAPRFPAAIRPSLSTELCEIVQRLLAKRLEDRFQSAKELAGALNATSLSPERHQHVSALVEGIEPDTAATAATLTAPSLPPPRATERHAPLASVAPRAPVRILRRHAGIGWLAVPALVGAAWLAVWRLPREARPPDPAIPSANDAKVEDSRATSTGPPTDREAPRDLDEWFAGLVLERKFTRLPSDPQALSFSPDSTRLAVGCGRWIHHEEAGSVRVYDVASGQLVAAVDDLNEVLSLQYSPDGRSLACVLGEFSTDPPVGTLQFWDASTCQPRQSVGDQPLSGSLSYNRDGTRLVVAGRTNSPVVWNVSGSTVEASSVLPRQEDTVSRAVYSPDGSLLATAGRNLPVRLWSADSLAPVRDVSASPLRAAKSTWLSWSADGVRLVAGTNNWPERVPSDLYVWDLAGGDTLQHYPHVENFGPCLFVADAAIVVTGGAESLLAWSVDETRPARILDGPTGNWFPDVAVSPDGNWLAAGRSSNRSVMLYRLQR